LDLNGFKLYNDSFGHAAGDALLVRLGSALRSALAGRARVYRLGGDEFCVLARGPEAHDDSIAARAAHALSDRGDGFSISASYGSVAMPNEAAEPSQALQIADQRMYAQKNGGRPSAVEQSAAVLLQALEERQPALGTHVDDVGELAEAVGRELGLADADLERVRKAGQLHDVGKVAIPDAILEKPGPLDDREWEFMKRHTLVGERIVGAAPALAEIGKLIRSSHERWDGHGYPDSLAGDQIPLGARIVSVCDAYDAIVTDRPYRPGRSHDEAIAELRRCAAKQFDPVVVDAFCRAISRTLTATAPGAGSSA
jgi:diguanylate cyclase (GGDEF)-like protein